VSYVLDTTILIDHWDGYAPAVELLEWLFAQPGELYTCDVVTCEALSKGDAEALRTKRMLLDALEYVAIPPESARWAADQRRRREDAKRKAPSTTDALIAAVASSMGATVITRNRKDFEAFDVPVLGYGEPVV
jgi:predicted nucleic acid-binding protein